MVIAIVAGVLLDIGPITGAGTTYIQAFAAVKGTNLISLIGTALNSNKTPMLVTTPVAAMLGDIGTACVSATHIQTFAAVDCPDIEDAR